MAENRENAKWIQNAILTPNNLYTKHLFGLWEKWRKI